jgi:hypothetical protein
MVQVFPHHKTKLGIWLENIELDETWLIQKTQISIPIVMRLVYDSSYKPSGSVIRKVYSVVKKEDTNLKLSDFWND